jgi:thiamine-monophosphate kinase
MPLSEFDLIERYFVRRGGERSDVVLGIGDDAALLRVPQEMDLVSSIDTLVAGVHFAEGADPVGVGHKALAVNLSDLAAMGAQPSWAILALSLPRIDEDWLEGFSRGFFALAERFRVQLVGGDTTQGPLCMSVHVHGLVPRGAALRRNAACPGDGIFVTGSLGDAGLALQALHGELSVPAPFNEHLARRLNYPEPRVHEGLAVRGIAHAAIDISDGLIADLGHILRASGLGATVELEQIPLSGEAAALIAQTGEWDLPLSAGDDYELCFTAPPMCYPELERAFTGFPCGFTRIGTIEKTPGLRCVRHDGTPVVVQQRGYQHFADQSKKLAPRLEHTTRFYTR